MLYLFLVQANGDALSEGVFKPLENLPFGVFWGVGIVASIYIFTECHLTFLLVLNTLK